MSKLSFIACRGSPGFVADALPRRDEQRGHLPPPADAPVTRRHGVRSFVWLVWLQIILLAPARGDGLTPPATAAGLRAGAVSVPAGEYRTGSWEPGCWPPERVRVNAFHVWPVELPRAWWLAFRGEDVPVGLDPAEPAHTMSYDDAQAFCVWLSERCGVTVRLPTAAEWQIAARAGTPGVTYPWGWNHPAGRAVFNASGPARSATLAPNPWGLFDMSGNLAEWVGAGEDDETAPAMGGSWAERTPRHLRIGHRLLLPKTYRDRDTGFRFVIEP